MLKPTKINLADTNLALFGTDTEKKIKEAASQHEAAWSVVGKGAGLFVWRIEKFKVIAHHGKDVGSFYDGDSYIILHSYQAGPTLKHDIHFWLGLETSQDEAGTAAYKTVELDDYLKGAAAQHREVMGYESDLFKTYFPTGICILHGGIDSGFHHVTAPEAYKPRLLRVMDRKHPIVREVEFSLKSLNSSEVFILDAGLKIYQFIGSKSSVLERGKAAQVTQQIDDDREGKPTKHIVHEGDDSHSAKHFWELLGAQSAQAIPAEPATVEEKAAPTKDLYRMHESSETHHLVTELVAQGTAVNRALLKSDDVFFLDLGTHVYVWIGSKTTNKEKNSRITSRPKIP